eukprot:5519595-Amphidinium_carterae.1
MEQGTTTTPAQPQTEPLAAAAPPVVVHEPAAAVTTEAPAGTPSTTEDPDRYTRMLPTVLGGTATD